MLPLLRVRSHNLPHSNPQEPNTKLSEYHNAMAATHVSNLPQQWPDLLTINRPTGGVS